MDLDGLAGAGDEPEDESFVEEAAAGLVSALSPEPSLLEPEPAYGSLVLASFDPLPERLSVR